jgi:hypothetical protein
VVAALLQGQRRLLFFLVHTLRAATFPASGSCRRQTGVGPFLNKVAFELGQRSKDMKDEFAAGGGGIQALLMEQLFWNLFFGFFFHLQ